MSFILVPRHGEDVQVNAWTWRPTLELLRSEGLLSQENYERMGANGCGGKVDDELAGRVADTIEGKLIGMKAGERILIDGTVTAEPRRNLTFTPDTKSDDIDPIALYTASYEWLVAFRDFCRRSGGFEVV